MKSIRRQLAWILSVSMVLLLLAGGAMVWVLVKRALVTQFDAALLQRARILAINIEEEDAEVKIDKNMLQQQDGNGSLTHAVFEILSADGKLLLSYERSRVRRFPDPPEPVQEEPVFYPVSLGPSTPGRAVALRMDAADDKLGLFRNLMLITALPAPDTAATMRSLTAVLAGTGALALLILLPLLQTALRRGLRPLDDLAARTAAIDEKKLDTRLPTDDCPVELQPVVTTLNALLERLEVSFAREKRFSSNVAHELRTPVAELRSLGELVAGWPAQATPEAFADVLAIAREMEETVSRLTLLGRAQAGSWAPLREPVELSPLLREVVGRLEPVTQSRRLHWDHQLEPVTLAGDTALWRMILTNLMGNAADHAPEGSTIRTRLGPAGLAVANPAPDLELADLPRLYERFWRKDSSRTGYGHSGLGLSLVQSLCGLLGLTPVARLEGGWLWITVDFPKPGTSTL